MADEPYTCWGDDGEDLSEQVRKKANPNPSTVVAVRNMGRAARPRRWRVVVTCSKGHDNVFEGEGAP